MKKFTIICDDCKTSITFIVDDDVVYTANYRPMKTDTTRELTHKPAAPQKIAKLPKRKWVAPTKPLPCRKCGRVFFYGGARYQHEKKCKVVPKKKG